MNSRLSSVGGLLLASWLVAQSLAAQDTQLEPPACRRCEWRVGAEVPMPSFNDGATWVGRPGGIAVEPDGTVWMSDLDQHQVIRLSTRGATVRRIGREGSGPGEFRAPSQLALSDSTIYVLDVALSRVSAFSLAGGFLRSFPMPVRILAPKGMVAENRGHLYVSGMAGGEVGRGRVIHQIDSAGKHIRSSGDQGEAFQALGDAIHKDGGPLYWDARTGLLWFARSGAQFELMRYGPDGTMISEVHQSLDVLDAEPVIAPGVDGSILLRPSVLFGAYAIVPMDSMLVVVSRISESGRMRYNGFSRRTGRHEAQWEGQETVRGGIVDSDGRGRVYVFRMDEEAPLRYADVHWLK